MKTQLRALACLAAVLAVLAACGQQETDPKQFTELLGSACEFAYNQTASDAQSEDFYRISNQCKAVVQNGTFAFISHMERNGRSLDKATQQARQLRFFKTELDQVRLSDLNPASVAYKGGKVSEVSVACMEGDCVHVQFETDKGKDQPFEVSTMVIKVREEKDAKQLADMLRNLIRSAR